MATQSLGYHEPSALNYLITESLLPPDPSSELYKWEVFADGGVEEELLSTKSCVVWSQGRIVRKLFNFSIEQQEVQHAKLTWFCDSDDQPVQRLDDAEPMPPKTRRQSSQEPRLEHNDCRLPVTASARAVVVFLKHQAHVFFLSGASHVVNLPFEVERAFPAPRGLIIQRKISSTSTTLNLSLKAPAPPQNSFLFPLSQFTPRHSSTVLPPAPTKASFEAATLDFDLLTSSMTPVDDRLPRHYSFTNPLSELALIVRSVSGDRPRNGYTSQAKSLTALDLEEDIIYVTPRDEFLDANSSPSESLTLIVTLNRAKAIYSLWHASYINSKPVSQLFSAKSTQSAGAKSRRRSSFVTTTGATTPAVPLREAARESLSVTRAKAGDKNPSNTNKKSKKARASKPIRHVETSLAAQVDPDFEPRQHTARESRRVSSMLSRADLNASFDRNVFQDLASQSGMQQSFGQSGRRGHSIGITERQSFGAGSVHRLRASTPSAFSQLSIEDMSENGTILHGGGHLSQASTTMDESEQYTGPDDGAADAEDVNPQNPLYGLKKELLIQKFADIPVLEITSSNITNVDFSDRTNALQPKVLTVASPVSCEEQGNRGRRFFLIIFDRASKECVQVEYSIQTKAQASRLSEPGDNTQVKHTLLPSFRALTRLEAIVDVAAVSDASISRLMLLKDTKSNEPSLWMYCPWSPEVLVPVHNGRMRIFNPHDVCAVVKSPRGIGAKRTTSLKKPLLSLRLSGAACSVDILTDDQKYHQVKLSLWPRIDVVSRLLEACMFVLPLAFGEKFLALWSNRNLAYRSRPDAEWRALVVSLFALFLSCEDERKSRRAQRNLAEVAEKKRDITAMMRQTQMTWNVNRNCQAKAWSWTAEATMSVCPISSSPQAGRESSGISTKPSEEVLSSEYADLARAFVKSADAKAILETIRKERQTWLKLFPRLVSIVHLLREESKLCGVAQTNNTQNTQALAPVIVQMARWLNWSEWDWKMHKYYSLEDIPESSILEDSSLFPELVSPPVGLDSPPSVLQWLEDISSLRKFATFPTFEVVMSTAKSSLIEQFEDKFIPRISTMNKFLAEIGASPCAAECKVEAMLESGVSSRMLETFSEGVLTILKESIVQMQATPPTTWPPELLTYVAREDLKLVLNPERLNWTDSHSGRIISSEAARDLHHISQSTEIHDSIMSFPNSERMAVSRLIFNQDRRFAEAVHMIEPYRVAVAECIPESGWSEARVLEAQREVHNWVMTRTFSLAPGLGFAHYDSRNPLLSEKFNIHGYNTLCVMKPMNNTVSVDRTLFTEEKYAWPWFHSGVAAGLSISKHAEGIDSSWIVFNRPADLNNRHAGLLLALGLNGHLRAMAKWLAFKYLTPKHTMTSIGLLLGLSASHIGTMDTLVTRLLSVHVTRMLPLGAAELNLSSLTQTAGLMGIGLLYHNTQHRRMSEVMLSEIENLEVEDLSGTTEAVRDESYRLAAGFALGLINLGQGSDLKGLHDVRLVERLLAVAVGPRPVNLINLMDQATAGSTIAIMLVFMKTENRAVARKIDVPDTVPQFDFVRPDILLLRTLAKHLIMWKEIQPEHIFILKNLPREYTKYFKLDNIMVLTSDHLPFYNILAGLLWAISLKFAGTGDENTRDFLIGYLDQFIRICRLSAQRYDSRLTRNSVRNCQDLVALAAATVMAGTGDLILFRRLRLLHGRVDPNTPYGSHMACHMALGALFFGAGCYTFGTTNLAIASLILSFYPVFPMDVTDNKAHLQAFRHFWALAAEARCVILRDIDTQRTISLDLKLHMRNGSTRQIKAPNLLPELVDIAKIETMGSEYWPVTLDLVNNQAHLAAFRKNQTLHVRRRPAHEAHTSTFTATLLALNEARSSNANAGEWIFKLPAFDRFEMADVAMFLDPEEKGGALLDLRGSAADERLSMGMTADKGWNRDDLWNLRILLRWADRRMLDGEPDLKWIRREVLDRWKALLEKRARAGDDDMSILLSTNNDKTSTSL